MTNSNPKERLRQKLSLVYQFLRSLRYAVLGNELDRVEGRPSGKQWAWAGAKE